MKEKWCIIPIYGLTRFGIEPLDPEPAVKKGWLILCGFFGLIVVKTISRKLLKAVLKDVGLI